MGRKQGAGTCSPAGGYAFEGPGIEGSVRLGSGGSLGVVGRVSPALLLKRCQAWGRPPSTAHRVGGRSPHEGTVGCQTHYGAAFSSTYL